MSLVRKSHTRVYPPWRWIAPAWRFRSDLSDRKASTSGQQHWARFAELGNDLDALFCDTGTPKAFTRTYCAVTGIRPFTDAGCQRRSIDRRFLAP